VTLRLLPSTPPGSSTPAARPLGSITPRLWTRPLRTLTPATSYGYRVIWFAREILGTPLDPWQQWLVIHLGELLPSGLPRFRRALVLVARQNGKTHVCVVLALYWLFQERIRLVFGSSTKLDYAAESWSAALNLATATPALAAKMQKPRLGKGEQTLLTADGCRYKIGTANRTGGRSLPIQRLIGDELREQKDWSAYNAAYNAMALQVGAQAVWISNAGDTTAVVLNSLRDDALALVDYAAEQPGVAYADLLEAGHDPQLGIFEWSAPPGTHPMDETGWAAANPQLGRRMPYSNIEGAARTVSRPGADPLALAGFESEVLCMGVAQVAPALDRGGWAAGLDPATLEAYRGRLAMCVDLSPDMQHATVAVAACLSGASVRVELVGAWSGPDAVRQLTAALPGLAATIRPRKIGWFPNGPAAALDAKLRDRRKDGVRGWPPPRVGVAEIKGDTAAVCMGFALAVTGAEILHSGDPLLDAQVEGAEKLNLGGGRFVFTRVGGGHVDAVYAAAGAVHLAKTIPARRPSTKMAVGGGR
jgi:hypothetical protein